MVVKISPRDIIILNGNSIPRVFEMTGCCGEINIQNDGQKPIIPAQRKKPALAVSATLPSSF